MHDYAWGRIVDGFVASTKVLEVHLAEVEVVDEEKEKASGHATLCRACVQWSPSAPSWRRRHGGGLDAEEETRRRLVGGNANEHRMLIRVYRRKLQFTHKARSLTCWRSPPSCMPSTRMLSSSRRNADVHHDVLLRRRRVSQISCPRRNRWTYRSLIKVHVCIHTYKLLAEETMHTCMLAC
jgi:hypothetical protein